MFKIVINLLIVFSLHSQGFLHTDGQKIVNGAGDDVILRGIGLGGWMLQEGYMMQTSSFAGTQHELKEKISQLVGNDKMEEFYDAWLANHCRKVDIDSLAKWGFNSVRLPMHYNLYTLPIEEESISGQNTWLEKGFQLTDSLLSWCASNNMYLILDLHAAPGGQGQDAAISDYDPSKPSLWQNAENRSKTVALWRKLAERYADEPWMGGYDLLNETNWNMQGNSLLKNLYLEITNAIREVDTNHIIYIEGNWFANDFTGLTPPWDDNMVYSFHKYWSHNDLDAILWMLSMRSNYNIPIWCGESGENSNVWFTDAIKLFEQNDIGWAWWPLKKIESISGPLSIIKPSGYQILLNYWQDESTPKPTEEFAVSALMELAKNSKLENCVYQKDVIDAMFRQVKSSKTIPYNENSVPGQVFAADFDLGIYNKAYNDKDIANYRVSTGEYTTWNTGWLYRNDGVDIQACKDEITNGYNIGWIEDREWLVYTINVTETDSFSLNLRIASENNDGRVRLLLDNEIKFSSVAINSTDGWQEWETVNIGNLLIEKGVHTLRIDILRGGFNLNYIDFIDMNAVNSGNNEPVKSFKLYQNYPNPVNPNTSIRYWLKKDSIIDINLYNVNGQKIKTLFNGEAAAGDNYLDLDSTILSSGIYFYTLESRNYFDVKKLMVIR